MQGKAESNLMYNMLKEKKIKQLYLALTKLDEKAF